MLTTTMNQTIGSQNTKIIFLVKNRFIRSDGYVLPTYDSINRMYYDKKMYITWISSLAVAVSPLNVTTSWFNIPMFKAMDRALFKLPSHRHLTVRMTSQTYRKHTVVSKPSDNRNIVYIPKRKINNIILLLVCPVRFGWPIRFPSMPVFPMKIRRQNASHKSSTSLWTNISYFRNSGLRICTPDCCRIPVVKTGCRLIHTYIK